MPESGGLSQWDGVQPRGNRGFVLKPVGGRDSKRLLVAEVLSSEQGRLGLCGCCLGNKSESNRCMIAALQYIVVIVINNN